MEGQEMGDGWEREEVSKSEEVSSSELTAAQ
jgi:hypothetical protein